VIGHPCEGASEQALHAVGTVNLSQSVQEAGKALLAHWHRGGGAIGGAALDLVPAETQRVDA
jgi:hypothetical protein